MAAHLHEQPQGAIELREYYPGLVGRIIQEHAVYYHANWGFDRSFEAQEGLELSQCALNLDPEREGLWAAMVGGQFAGSVAIATTEEGARLRWFLVRPQFHGHGLGKLLLERALQFCRERQYRRVHLWTFRGLEAARRLYLAYGFKLVEENLVRQWGRELYEQKYELSLSSPSAGELSDIL